MSIPPRILGNLMQLTDLGLIKTANLPPFSTEGLKLLENLSHNSTPGTFNLEKLVELVKQHPVLAISIIAGSLLALRVMKSKDTENHPYFLLPYKH